MKRFLPALVSGFLSAVMAVPAFAGSQEDAVIALHAKPHAEKALNICPGGDASEDPNTQGLACSDYDVAAPANESVDVYLVVAKGSSQAGIAGLSCGIRYDADISMFGWTLCSDLEFSSRDPNPTWPASGSANRITWTASTNCQRTEFGEDGAHAVAGSFYIYAYGDGIFDITTNNTVQSGAELQVADCASAESNILEAASVGFGTLGGCNPCLDDCVVPVVPVTWGKIKSTFE